MRRNPDDPFDDLFRQLEEFMTEVMQPGGGAGPTGQPGPSSDETHLDVHEYDDRITVIADLPGVEKDDIELSCDGTIVTIAAETDRRRYNERVQLPGTVDPDTASAKYNNGVLEIQFERTAGSASIDVE